MFRSAVDILSDYPEAQQAIMNFLQPELANTQAQDEALWASLPESFLIFVIRGGIS